MKQPCSVILVIHSQVVDTEIGTPCLPLPRLFTYTYLIIKGISYMISENYSSKGRRYSSHTEGAEVLSVSSDLRRFLWVAGAIFSAPDLIATTIADKTGRHASIEAIEVHM